MDCCRDLKDGLECPQLSKDEIDIIETTWKVSENACVAEWETYVYVCSSYELSQTKTVVLFVRSSKCANQRDIMLRWH